MSDQDVFNEAENDNSQAGTPETPQDAPETSSVDVFADQLSSITNEDGTPKYPDVASALSSIPHAQKHIQTLEAEAEELRKKLAQEQAAKDLLAKQVGKNETPTQQSLTEAQVAEIAKRAQQEAIAEQTAKANIATVNRAFSTQYGAKAIEMMRKVAQESDMSIAEIRNMAAKSPKAVFRLAGIVDPTPKPTPPRTPGQGQGDHFQQERQPAPPKSIMGGSSTADVLANWRAAGEAVKAHQT